jgi:hypothetical protein
MRRREFITLLGGSAAMWPVAARGHPSTRPHAALMGCRGADLGLRVALGPKHQHPDPPHAVSQSRKYRWSTGEISRMRADAA